MKNIRYTLFLAFLLLAGCATKKNALEAYLQKNTSYQPKTANLKDIEYAVVIPEKGCPTCVRQIREFAQQQLPQGQLLVLALGDKDVQKRVLGDSTSIPQVIYADGQDVPGLQPYINPGFPTILNLKKRRIVSHKTIDAAQISQELYLLDMALKGTPVTYPEGTYTYMQVEEVPECLGEDDLAIGDIVGRLSKLPIIKQQNPKGVIAIEYEVTPEGQMVKPRMVRNTLGCCEQEILSALDSMPAWKPGKVKGKPVTTVMVTPPINFQ